MYLKGNSITGVLSQQLSLHRKKKEKRKTIFAESTITYSATQLIPKSKFGTHAARLTVMCRDLPTVSVQLLGPVIVIYIYIYREKKDTIESAAFLLY